MYLIPKNIKTKKEIFKGFGIFECIAIALSIGIGYLCSLLVKYFKFKVLFISAPPILTFLLLFPLPNGSTTLNILNKFIKFRINQKNYKLKG